MLCPLNSSANGLMGTVAGTVINTLLYNTCEATDGTRRSTDNLDVMSEDTTEYTKGFDPLMVGTTTGRVGTCVVHVMGRGKAMSRVCVETAENEKNGRPKTAAMESLH